MPIYRVVFTNGNKEDMEIEADTVEERNDRIRFYAGTLPRRLVASFLADKVLCMKRIK